MSEISVVPVSNQNDWKAFFQLPRTIYLEDAVHVPELEAVIRDELNARTNPVHRFCQSQALIAKRANQIVARAVVINNPRLSERLKKSTGLIGYFECSDDVEAAAAMFQACEDWCAGRGATQLLGEIRFSLNYPVGVLTSGFDQPHTMLMPHHPPYYRTLFERTGFRTIKRLHAYKVDLVANRRPLPAVLARARQLQEEGFRVRRMRKSDLRPCLLDSQYNQNWTGNFGHTAFSLEELNHVIRKMTRLIGLSFCFVAEKEGEIAGYLFSFMDINERIRGWGGRIGLRQLFDFVWAYKIRHAVTGLKAVIIGVPPAFRGRQISALLNSALIEEAVAHGFQYLECSWILEDNIASIKQATRLGGVLYKTYDIFGRDLVAKSSLLCRKARR